MAKVLIIDDHEDTRELLRVVLETEGYDVDLAENGVHGLELFRTNSPTIIVSDIFMPEMDGIELIRVIKRENPAIPIVVISAGAFEGKLQMLEACTRLGASRALEKPFAPEELVAAVRDVLAEID